MTTLVCLHHSPSLRSALIPNFNVSTYFYLGIICRTLHLQTNLQSQSWHNLLTLMKIRKVAYVNAPPYIGYLAKMRLCQVALDQNTPGKREKGNYYQAERVMTFFPLAFTPWAHQGVIWKSG